MSSRTVEARAAEGLDLSIDLAEAERVIEWVLDAEGVDEAEVSVAFVGDTEIAALNEQYLSHEGATDVISFPLHRPGGAPLGDIYIGARHALRQAEELGISAREELLRLCVHGALHVLGFDHPAGPDRESSPMYLRQEELLAAFLRRAG